MRTTDTTATASNTILSLPRTERVTAAMMTKRDDADDGDNHGYHVHCCCKLRRFAYYEDDCRIGNNKRSHNNNNNSRVADQLTTSKGNKPVREISPFRGGRVTKRSSALPSPRSPALFRKDTTYPRSNRLRSNYNVVMIIVMMMRVMVMVIVMVMVAVTVMVMLMLMLQVSQFCGTYSFCIQAVVWNS